MQKNKKNKNDFVMSEFKKYQHQISDRDNCLFHKYSSSTMVYNEKPNIEHKKQQR